MIDTYSLVVGVLLLPALYGLVRLLGSIFTNRSIQIDRARSIVASVQPRLYMDEQHKLYLELWEALASLEDSVEALWNDASIERVIQLAEQLESTRRMVRHRAILICEEHETSLNDIFSTLESYNVGKMTLSQLKRETLNKEYVTVDQLDAIRTLIEANGKFRENFNNTLEDIKNTFRKRLGGHALMNWGSLQN